MTEYAELPNVNALYNENENIERALSLIEAGGPLTGFSLGPPPGVQMREGLVAPITVSQPTGPTSPELQAALVAALEQRQSAILAELASLGVTTAPPAHSPA